MTKALQQRWDDRYKAEEFAYGTEPNKFLKEQIQQLHAGAILFGAEGEGRNAVYAAKQGWDVSAFDISMQGRKKAMGLAHENNVTIAYKVGELPKLDYENESFDVIALIFAHFPPHIRSEYHAILDKKLKPGGILIFEGFSKNHLAYRRNNPAVGGPNNLDMLFSIDELKQDFAAYEILLLEEKEIELNEGLYHNGQGSVTRFVGQKK